MASMDVVRLMDKIGDLSDDDFEDLFDLVSNMADDRKYGRRQKFSDDGYDMDGLIDQMIEERKQRD
jgi:hypothetical protein